MDKIKQWKDIESKVNQTTRDIIKKFLPMWTNKEIWEFEQLNEELKFDTLYVKPNNSDVKSRNSELECPNTDIRDSVIKNFDYLAEGHELWIKNKGQNQLDAQYFPYVMSVMADIMIDEEICLNFKTENDCLGTYVDSDADVIDCKEFFEEFYHLATGFNYNVDTGIPSDETEAEMYLTRLQDEFDEKMKSILGNKYLPGNNDPDSINSE